MIQEAQAKQLLEETFARMNPGEAWSPAGKSTQSCGSAGRSAG